LVPPSPLLPAPRGEGESRGKEGGGRGSGIFLSLLRFRRKGSKRRKRGKRGRRDVFASLPAPIPAIAMGEVRRKKKKKGRTNYESTSHPAGDLPRS